MIIIKTIKYFIPGIVAILFVGCTHPEAPKPLYNYGDYGKSYYDYKKTMTPESTLAFQESIQKAIDGVDGSSSRRVPPGMYANLGYMYLKSGKPNEAKDYFKKEKSTYPESTLFMDRMIKKIEIVEGGSK